ncbi:hypothetical protein [Allopusillimonas ginsengisoli]|uniref:hypothetical protein n=1 Tax=Allopusillimonas ginsengisoli TaxID=453575 RepID=UPI001FD659B8|nr:hypothetical protein [Allopusillimonas ginsengisoli]
MFGSPGPPGLFGSVGLVGSVGGVSTPLPVAPQPCNASVLLNMLASKASRSALADIRRRFLVVVSMTSPNVVFVCQRMELSTQKPGQQ